VDQRLLWFILVAVIVSAALAVWLSLRRQRSRHLRERFGPEYERTLERAGDQRHAEAELEAREKRVAKIEIHPLSEGESTRFWDRWLAIQKRFVDSPRESVAEADRLVIEVMEARGYPMADFEQRAADVSVHHQQVVSNYRAARAIAERGERSQAGTEELRKAVVYYRDLFEELLEAPRAARAGGKR